MRNLDDARLVTRRYHALRGLEMAPLWAGIFLTSIGDALGFTRPGNLVPRVLMLLATITVAVLLHRYINRRFGVVRQPSHGGVAVALFLGFIVFQVLMVQFGIARDFTAPALAILAGWAALRDHGFRKHWLVPAIACALLSLSLPVATKGPAPAGVQTVEAIRWAIIAATFCFASVYDHRLLVRIFDDGA